MKFCLLIRAIFYLLSNVNILFYTFLFILFSRSSFNKYNLASSSPILLNQVLASFLPVKAYFKLIIITYSQFHYKEFQENSLKWSSKAAILKQILIIVLEFRHKITKRMVRLCAKFYKQIFHQYNGVFIVKTMQQTDGR